MKSLAALLVFLLSPFGLAELVTVTLELPPAMATRNTLNLEVQVPLLGNSDDDTALSGTIANDLAGADFEAFTASALLPNGLLWALGYQADERPGVLTPQADTTFTLALPGGGTAGEVFIETATDLTSPWAPVPASEISTSGNPLPAGTTGTIVISPRGAGPRFFRLRANEPSL
jgi:hypothetical protein